jgi:hypothetical protein
MPVHVGLWQTRLYWKSKSDGVGLMPFGFCSRTLIVEVESILSKAWPQGGGFLVGKFEEGGRIGKSNKEGSRVGGGA